MWKCSIWSLFKCTYYKIKVKLSWFLPLIVVEIRLCPLFVCVRHLEAFLGPGPLLLENLFSGPGLCFSAQGPETLGDCVGSPPPRQAPSPCLAVTLLSFQLCNACAGSRRGDQNYCTSQKFAPSNVESRFFRLLLSSCCLDTKNVERYNFLTPPSRGVELLASGRDFQSRQSKCRAGCLSLV